MAIDGTGQINLDWIGNWLAEPTIFSPCSYIFRELQKGIATDFFQKNIVLPSMDDILNPCAATLEVVNICCVYAEEFLTRVILKYRPEYRCVGHPFRETWKKVTKVCNAQKKVSFIKRGDIDGNQKQPNAYSYIRELYRT